MRNSIGLAALSLVVLMAESASAYEPEAWNLRARKAFANQRFGVFIHWGIYSNYAQGEWYLQTGGLDREAYERMKDGFCPSKFDAREWAKAIAGAGAKYITITTRHHDGFSLWPTQVDDGYNIAQTPFGRDVLGELKAACDEEGLQLNFYYSLMDWHRKDYPAGSVARTILGDQKGDYASYKKFMLGQIGELIARYHPGSIWLDGEWEHAHCQDDGTWKRTLDWEFDDIYDFIHERRTLVANNNHQPIRAKEDIQLFERDLPGEDGDAGFSRNQPVVNDRPVEQCDVIQSNVWGYRIGERGFRAAPDVVAMVARAAAKGSNLLMNIGPDGSGRLPAKAVAVLGEVGQWFGKNGESIYGTDAGGFSLGKAVVSTRAGGVLYLHFLDPKTNVFEFATDVNFACENVVSTGVRVPIGKTADGRLRIVAPRAADDMFDVVIRLTPAIVNPFRRFAIELEAPKPAIVPRFCDFVRNRLAKDGVDTIVLRTGCRYAFESHPECRGKDPLSKADAQTIAEACRAANVKLVAKMNLFGHQGNRSVVTEGLLKAHPDMDESQGVKVVRANYCRSICPRHPESLKYAADLAAELAQAYGTDVVHFGCDEVFEIGRCPRCRDTPTATLFADWVNALSRALKARGVRQTMIWGDRLIDFNLTGGKDYWESSDNGTWKALGKIDKDIEICDWRYNLRDGYPSVGLFGDAGYRIWVSPWSNPYATELYLSAAKAQDMGHVIGLLHTTWMDVASFMDLIEGREVDFVSRNEKTDRNYVIAMRGSVDVYLALTHGRQGADPLDKAHR